MTWPEKIDAASKALDLLIKAEVHAFVLILTGVFACLHNHSDVGTPVITAGLAIFRGNR